MATEHHPPHDEHHHGLAHVLPVRVLLGTWIALMILTGVTVLATKIDFGPSMNLAIAMAIAVVKATLVILFFMHLFYDRLFHSVVLVAGFLGLALFVGFALMDTSQYQESIIWRVQSGP